MAMFHLSAKIIGRSGGSNALASAAYRSGSELVDRTQDPPVTYNFSNKSGVIFSEILGPPGTPERLKDRETLWNEVEKVELRKNSQLAREIEFAIPRELDRVEAVRLAREYVQAQFVARGMIADLNIHWDFGKDGEPKPHAHVMLGTREIIPDRVVDGEVVLGGFGKKVTAWNDRSMLIGWREAWATAANARLAELGIDARIDHRSFADQGIELIPQGKIGPAAGRLEERGEPVDQAARHREIARTNGAAIVAEPSIALAALTRLMSTFTTRDIELLAHRQSDSRTQYQEVVAAVLSSPELVALGQDDRGRERFSSKEMIEVERGLELRAEALANKREHAVSELNALEVVRAFERGSLTAQVSRDAVSEGRSAPATGEGRGASAGLALGDGQRDALIHIVGGADLSMVVGLAGSGKSTLLGAAREVWEGQGYRVLGAALAGVAAEGLETGSGIASRTIASWEYAWRNGRDVLGAKDIFVIDEAALVGSRQLERVFRAVEAAGAKAILVGDPEQLQSIEAGAAFRALLERHGAAELTEVRRQTIDWQQNATRELATARTATALGRYLEAGFVQAFDTRDEAKSALVKRWAEAKSAYPDERHILLAHTRVDVADLNGLARDQMRTAGALGLDLKVETSRGELSFAVGDQVMFVQNDRVLGVRNGTIGHIAEISDGRMSVRVGSGQTVQFDLNAYNHVAYGYASTLHKAQGVTVDRAFVLASDGLDRHATYVGLSRHRSEVLVHFGRDDFRDFESLQRGLGRERAKDITLDYIPRFAANRGLEGVAAAVPTPAPKKRGLFAGVKFRAKPEIERDPISMSPGISRAALDYAEARGQVLRAQKSGERPIAHVPKLEETRFSRLEAMDPKWARATKEAISRLPELAIGNAIGGRLDRDQQATLIQAVSHEMRVMQSPELRADRFLERWTQLNQRQSGLSDGSRREVLRAMKLMAAGLDDDPAVKRIVAHRVYGVQSPDGPAQTNDGLSKHEPERDIGREWQLELQRIIDKSLDRGMSR